jgi:hypothetical protein
MAFTDVPAVRTGGGTLGEAVVGLNDNQKLLSESVKPASPEGPTPNPKTFAPTSDLLKLPDLSSMAGKELAKFDPRPAATPIAKFTDPAKDIILQPKFRPEINVTLVKNSDGSAAAFGTSIPRVRIC